MIPSRSHYPLESYNVHVCTRLGDGGVSTTLHTVRVEDTVLCMYSVQADYEVVLAEHAAARTDT